MHNTHKVRLRTPVDVGSRMIYFPVEPVVVQDGNLVEAVAGQRAADRLSRKIPLAACFRIEQAKWRRISFGKELQLSAIHPRIESPNRFPVVPNYNHEGNAAQHIQNGASQLERCERIRLRRLSCCYANY